MVKIINFHNHPLVMGKQEADYYLTKCTLINNDVELPTCYGYNDECQTCEVPKHFEKAQTKLTKLILTGDL